MFGLGKKKCPVCLTKEVKGSGVEVNGVWYCSEVHKNIAVKPAQPAAPAQVPQSNAVMSPVVPVPAQTPNAKKIPVEY